MSFLRPRPELSPVVQVIECGPAALCWIPKEAPLSDAEATCCLHRDEIARAEEIRAPQRKTEFLRSRWLFHQISGETSPLLRGSAGEPQWPMGLIGSISHKEGHVIAAISSTSHYRSIGVDMEGSKRVRPHLKGKICTDRDEDVLVRLAADDRYGVQGGLAVIFSIKEALFKCLYPLGREMFWFEDAVLETIDLAAGRATCRLNREVAPGFGTKATLEAHFSIFAHAADNYVVSALVVPHFPA